MLEEKLIEQEKQIETRLGVDKVKPKGWLKYFLYVD